MTNSSFHIKRTSLNFIIDAVAFTGFVVLTTTGVLMRYILPPGSGHYSTIWDLDRHDWGGIHFWVAVVFFLILALHLVLHWRWIVRVLTGRPREGSGFRVGLGIVGLVTVIALSVAPLLAPVERDTGSGEASPGSGQEYDAMEIFGSMTFREVEDLTGVPASYIINTLTLPETVSEDERIGPLKHRYDFEIDDIREIVKGYKNGK